MNLEGKNVLVTGGSSGVGLAIASSLAAKGCKLVICARREEVLRAAVESTHATLPMHWKTCDVSDRASVTGLFKWLIEENREPDILVNCAGSNVANRSMADIDPEDFERIMAINATGTFNMMHAALPAMRRRKDGLIINIVSIAGRRIFQASGVSYTASKFAQAAIGLFVNFETANHGVRVTNIYPGEVNTPHLDKRRVVPLPEKRAQMLQPEDLGHLVACIAQFPSRAIISDLVITPSYSPQP